MIKRKISLESKKGMYMWQVVIGAILSALIIFLLSNILFTTSDGAQDVVDRASMTNDFSNSGVVDALDQCPCDINNVLVTRGSGEGWCVAQGIEKEEANMLQSTLPDALKQSLEYDETIGNVVYKKPACLWAIQNEEWPSQKR